MKIPPSVAFISSVTYALPLVSSERKKFLALTSLAPITVIGFSHSGVIRREDQGVRFYLIPRRGPALVRYTVFLLWAVIVGMALVSRGRISIFVAQGPYEALAPTLIRWCARAFRRRVGLIVESHGDFEGGLFLQRRVWTRTLYRCMMQPTARLTIRSADALRAISRSTERQLKKFAPQTPIVAFPAWTDLDLFLQAIAPSGRSEHDILFAGALVETKGVRELVRAFDGVRKRCPHARLLLVGASPDPRYRREVDQEVERVCGERIQIRSKVSQEELAALMAAAAVVVLPSIAEGLGRVVFEAMATGAPVVGTAVGGIVDMIEHGRNGMLVPAGDANALGEAIVTLLRDRPRAAALGEEARRFAQGFFSTERYKDGYRKLLSLAEPPP